MPQERIPHLPRSALRPAPTPDWLLRPGVGVRRWSIESQEHLSAVVGTASLSCPEPAKQVQRALQNEQLVCEETRLEVAVARMELQEHEEWRQELASSDSKWRNEFTALRTEHQERLAAERTEHKEEVLRCNLRSKELECQALSRCAQFEVLCEELEQRHHAAEGEIVAAKAAAAAAASMSRTRYADMTDPDKGAAEERERRHRREIADLQLTIQALTERCHRHEETIARLRAGTSLSNRLDEPRVIQRIPLASLSQAERFPGEWARRRVPPRSGGRGALGALAHGLRSAIPPLSRLEAVTEENDQDDGSSDAGQEALAPNFGEEACERHNAEEVPLGEPRDAGHLTRWASLDSVGSLSEASAPMDAFVVGGSWGGGRLVRSASSDSLGTLSEASTLIDAFVVAGRLDPEPPRCVLPLSSLSGPAAGASAPLQAAASSASGGPAEVRGAGGRGRPPEPASAAASCTSLEAFAVARGLANEAAGWDRPGFL